VCPGCGDTVESLRMVIHLSTGLRVANRTGPFFPNTIPGLHTPAPTPSILLLDEVGECLDLIVDVAFGVHQLLDLGHRMHDRRVIAASEFGTDPG
jgi:hypothetical protein